MKMKSIVILVGGEGLRLRPLTENLPKALIPIKSQPLIYWILKWLEIFKIKKCVFGVAYKKEKIIEYLEKSQFNKKFKIFFSEHTVEGGTSQGFKLAIERFIKDKNFFAMNGDEITNLDLKNLEKFHLKNKGIATLAISPYRSPFGVVDVYGDNIIGFREKPILPNLNVSCGIYAFNRKILNFLIDKGNVENDVFPKLAEMGLLKAYKLSLNERWVTVNTLKDIKNAEEELEIMRLIK